MGQVSSKLRRSVGGYSWFCEACQEMHPLPDGWTFDGDLEHPTFSPSFLHRWKRFPSYTEDGLGEGEPFPYVCHYIVTAGIVNYCGDCTHCMAGQSVPMPDLPPGHQDAI